MMRLFISVVMAVIWSLLSGSLTPLNFVFGFVLSLFTMFLLREQKSDARPILRPVKIATLLLVFFVELAKSAIRVATLVLRPKLELRPAIFAYPLTLRSDWEIALLANLITLTPGTLSVDVSDDRTTLFVHAVDCPDVEEARRDIADGFERRIREAFAR